MTRYQNNGLQALAEQQTRFAPTAVRQSQLEEAERLLLELELDRVYGFADVCHRVTGYRPRNPEGSQIPGNELAHDLRCLIEDLSSTIPADATSIGERVLTVEQVSERLKISSKTVGRWRDKGLPSRWFLIEGRKRLGVRESSLERFVEMHQEEVMRGQSFRQMTEKEREQIILEARELAAQGLTLTDAGRVLSEKHGRALETIRYTLRDFDTAHPENAIFRPSDRPLSSEMKQLAYDLAQQGVSIHDLARRFSRSKTAIHAALAEVRTQRLCSMSVEFIDNEEFRTPDAELRIVVPAPPGNRGSETTRVPSGLPAYLSDMYRVPLLNREQEQHYFRLMNFRLYQLSELQKKLDPRRPSNKLAAQADRLLADIADTKNLLIRSNLRLVVSIAKKHLKPGVNFFELVSDGNMSLIRSVEKFDYSRGNKFSTYASWAIMKNFARTVPAENTRLDRFRTGQEEVFGASVEERTSQFECEHTNRAQRAAILEMMEELNGREQKVIAFRFGLETGTEPETLEEVGVRLGVTKERVRQIEVRTLAKLRRIAERRRVEIPGI